MTPRDQPPRPLPHPSSGPEEPAGTAPLHAARPVTSSSTYPSRPSRPRILLVDDDEDLRSCLVRLLATRALVQPAGAPREGLEHLRDTRFDVVLSDQNLRGELGSDFLARALVVQPEALRLLMSSDDVPNRFTGAVTWHHFLRKPFDPRAVLNLFASKAVEGR